MSPATSIKKLLFYRIFLYNDYVTDNMKQTNLKFWDERDAKSLFFSRKSFLSIQNLLYGFALGRTVTGESIVTLVSFYCEPASEGP